MFEYIVVGTSIESVTEDTEPVGSMRSKLSDDIKNVADSRADVFVALGCNAQAS
jgi:hypothetical protein